MTLCVGTFWSHRAGLRKRRSLGILILLAQLSVAAYHPLTAAPGGPPTWLEMQTPVARTQVEVGARFHEKHAVGDFRQERAGELLGSLALGNHVALSAGGGYGERRRTDQATVRVRDRYQLGGRVAFSGGFEDGSPAFAIGLHLFARPPKPVDEGVDPDLFLARLVFSGATRIGSSLELLGEFSFQSETNRGFQEDDEQEFRRHYGVGGGVAYRLTPTVRLLLEARYFVPYNPRIDADVRALRAHPGAVFTLSNTWELYASLVIAVRVENELDRGFRFGAVWRPQ